LQKRGQKKFGQAAEFRALAGSNSAASRVVKSVGFFSAADRAAFF
jgi:hypothetical protein